MTEKVRSEETIVEINSSSKGGRRKSLAKKRIIGTSFKSLQNTEKKERKKSQGKLQVQKEVGDQAVTTRKKQVLLQETRTHVTSVHDSSM